MGGKVDKYLIDLVLNPDPKNGKSNRQDIYNWFHPKDANKAVKFAKRDGIENYIYKERIFPNEKIKTQARKIVESTSSKYCAPGYCEDVDIQKLLKYVKIGVLTSNSEHDILHDDVNRWYGRLVENNEKNADDESTGKKMLKLVHHKGATHGFVTYASDNKEKLPGQFKLLREFCEEIKEIMA